MRSSHYSFAILFLGTALITAILPQISHAQESGTVHKLGETRTFSGTFTTLNKNEIVLTLRGVNRPETIPANLLTRIDFQGEPAGLGLARATENTGNLQAALDAYDRLLPGISAARLKSEVEFLIARTTAKLSKSDPQKAELALTRIKAFLAANPDHYRFYPACQLQGEVALTLKNWEEAEAAFRLLDQAPWNEVKVQGKIGLAQSLFEQQKIADAKVLFDEAVASPAQNEAEQIVQRQAILGQSRCLLSQKQMPEARTNLQKIVVEASREENRTLAEAYLLLGNSYVGDPTHAKDALLAYLHLDVLSALSAFPDLHAEALYHLSQLWPVMSQPARGSDALVRLQQQYPESEWARLAGSTPSQDPVIEEVGSGAEPTEAL